MSDDTRHPLATKIHLFRALYRLNRGFETALTELKRLSELGLDRIDLSEHEVNVELARAELNDELTGLLQSYEQEDEYYWGDRRKALERQGADPDDVFFKAQERQQEIKQQIKNLQAGLARQHPRQHRKTQQPKKRKRARKSKPPESLNHRTPVPLLRFAQSLSRLRRHKEKPC